MHRLDRSGMSWKGYENDRPTKAFKPPHTKPASPSGRRHTHLFVRLLRCNDRGVVNVSIRHRDPDAGRWRRCRPPSRPNSSRSREWRGSSSPISGPWWCLPGRGWRRSWCCLQGRRALIVETPTPTQKREPRKHKKSHFCSHTCAGRAKRRAGIDVRVLRQ